MKNKTFDIYFGMADKKLTSALSNNFYIVESSRLNPSRVWLSKEIMVYFITNELLVGK